MSENNHDPFTDAAQRFQQGQNHFTRMWTDFAGKMATAGVSFAPESTPPDAARHMRDAFFKALSGYCEDYMRSPEFLGSWRKAMDGAIEFRREMNQTLGKMHHDFGGTSRQDVDGLMVALTHLERRLVDTIERASEQVEALSRRVGELEKEVSVLSKPRNKDEKKTKGRKPD